MLNKLQHLHPFLFAFLPALALWSHNFDEVFVREVLTSLGLLIVYALVSLAFFMLIIRELHRAEIATSIFLVLTLSYQNLLGKLAAVLGSNTYTFILVFAIVISATILLIKSRRDFSGVTKILSTFAAAFLAISIAQVAYGYYDSYRHGYPDEIALAPATNDGVKRDIYYIILDEFTSPDVLENLLGYEEIDKTVVHLTNDGFFFPDGKTNYTSSGRSLLSALNLRHVTDKDTPKVRLHLLEDHLLGSFLQNNGYEYVHFGAPWITYFNKYADRNVNIIFWSEYQRLLFKGTILAPINDRLDFLNTRQRQYDRIHYQLAELAKLADDPNPTFAFAHFFVPHVPYVFNADGSFPMQSDVDERTEIQNYLEQVAYISGEIEALADTLIKNSETQPIIIFQGDHGFRFLHNRETSLAELGLDENDIPEHSSAHIFNAIYFPDGGSNDLYSTITPINVIRTMLNVYFGQHLPLVEDVTYNVDDEGLHLLK